MTYEEFCRDISWEYRDEDEPRIRVTHPLVSGSGVSILDFDMRSTKFVLAVNRSMYWMWKMYEGQSQ